jgi:hypothetical protein
MDYRQGIEYCGQWTTGRGLSTVDYREGIERCGLWTTGRGLRGVGCGLQAGD